MANAGEEVRAPRRGYYLTWRSIISEGMFLEARFGAALVRCELENRLGSLG